ncbi:MAG: aminopeptidase [Caldilineales bacterium]|nr:aminopeptidase [Caldilineales bacterium]
MNDTLNDLRPGARTAVRTCMNVQPADRVLILTDDACLTIGEALALEALATGAAVSLHRLEAFAPRPILDLPAGLQETYEQARPTVSFFAASSQPGEIAFRVKLGQVLRGHGAGVRHGHMPGVSPVLMREGMTTDYDRIYEITNRVTAIARTARTMHITNPKGTDLHAEFSPDLRWVPCHGRYHTPGDWGNLPEGETFTSPANLHGVLVADILGDHFSDKYGLLKHPVRFTLADGVVVDVACADQALADEVIAYLDSSENGRRAGEFAIGTNVGLTRLVGNLLQDEKYPGIHVAFGNPYPDRTGAQWTASIHVDVIPTDCTIDVDGRRIMNAGVFTDDIVGY